MNEALKPCPFCGEQIKPARARQASTDKTEGFVAFAACYCGGHSATAHRMGRGSTEQEAIQDVIAKWNRRASLTSAPSIHSGDLDNMVSRFLSWSLPTEVCADPCASMSGYPHHRSGTNLLTAPQARVMLEHVLIDHSAHDLKMVEQPSAAQAKPSIESVLLWLNYYVAGQFNTDDRGPRNALNILCAAFAVDLSSTQAGGRE